MKKFVVLVLVALVSVGSAFAAEGNTLTVNATVNQYLAIGLPLLANTTGTISMTATGDGSVATTGDVILRAWSNRSAWTITFQSLNTGMLKATDLSDIPYILTVTSPTSWASGSSVTNNPLSPGARLSDDEVITAVGRTPKTGVDFIINATVSAQNDSAILYENGSYSDTITITIAHG